ncbi:MAG: ribosome silencing factor [Acidimicrobiaceae bacterium]|nr:ribosome silencing factor [Ilumatobacter sp.]MCB9382632.1 ribosome silencing factor [Acidimicrobiaceae bacterium]MCO5332087.1 ribosome silencing factor [Ilumatobacteraceae bacterium]
MTSRPQQTAAEAAVALARVAARAADDKKAEQTLILAVGDVLAITDYFVITSASNRRLVKTVVDAVEEAVKLELGRSPVRTEGVGEQQWVLVDYGDVVVHVFAEEIRMYYEIERLYRDVPKVEWRSEAV